MKSTTEEPDIKTDIFYDVKRYKTNPTTTYLTTCHNIGPTVSNEQNELKKRKLAPNVQS